MSDPDISTAPTRLARLPSWLLTQSARHVHRVVSGRLGLADARGYHYRALAALEEYGSLCQADLGRRAGMDRSDIVATVNELADRRFVDRSPDPTDRRRNIISVTRRGRQHLRTLDDVLVAAQDEAFASLDPAERAQLAVLLTKVLAHHTRQAKGSSREPSTSDGLRGSGR
ncbi:MAG: MarR family transcriptional regulator [Rhodococcus sp. (in: high G+C Gram-positive bacteria)]|nr:MarR family transcriptional regulator [Rhodococcus sp. (in: high G+C Gram-positive bacteria)]MDX5454488.1 MarR family transcriptional regulator [Rhodococcus sp. (in: high G+C Gram-positive bacteria)]